MPEEKTQTQQRRRVGRVDIRSHDTRTNGALETTPQHAHRTPANIAQKRRVLDLQRRKDEGRRSSFGLKKRHEKLVGIGFSLIMGVAIFKELIDPFILVMQFLTDVSTVVGVSAGLATESTTIGVVVGGIVGGIVKAASFIPKFGEVIETTVETVVETPFNILWWTIGVVATSTASFIIWLYLFVYNGIYFGIRKLFLFLLVLLIEIIPVVNLIPSTVFLILTIKRMENKK